jgi:hypothetical protein
MAKAEVRQTSYLPKAHMRNLRGINPLHGQRAASHQQLQSILERLLAPRTNKRCRFLEDFGGAARI